MQRQQYKEVISTVLNKRIIELDAEIQEFGHASVFTETDNMLAMLINKIGTNRTLRLVELFNAKAVTDVETFLGPDVFTDIKGRPFQGELDTTKNELQWAGCYSFPANRAIFPIELRDALQAMAKNLMCPKIDPSKPLQRIHVRFENREKQNEPNELTVTFFTEGGEIKHA
ncbi:MAG TPA: hypothetical protein DCS05_05185 [Nitrospiraceae bacterium]|nr:hypothetical protein [Nitrospiraceae bacterium]